MAHFADIGTADGGTPEEHQVSSGKFLAGVAEVHAQAANGPAEERLRLREESLAWQEKYSVALQEKNQLLEQVGKLTREVSELSLRIGELQQELAQAASRHAQEAAGSRQEHERQLAAAQAERQAEVGRLLRELEQLALQNNAQLKELRALHERNHELAVRVHALPPASVPAAVAEDAEPASSARRQAQVQSPAATPKAAGPAKLVPAPVTSRAHPGVKPPKWHKAPKPLLSRPARLWRKLRQDPHQFFSDSGVPPLRALRHLFKPT
jgi:hypothetical protein